MVHLEQREHACPHCPGVAYQTKSYLKTHIETVHEKRRDHACPYCPGVAFGRKSHLKTHIATVHEKRRDHVCGYCKDVAFGTANTLKAHISVVHLKIKRLRGTQISLAAGMRDLLARSRLADDELAEQA